MGYRRRIATLRGECNILAMPRKRVDNEGNCVRCLGLKTGIAGDKLPAHKAGCESGGNANAVAQKQAQGDKPAIDKAPSGKTDDPKMPASTGPATKQLTLGAFRPASSAGGSSSRDAGGKANATPAPAAAAHQPGTPPALLPHEQPAAEQPLTPSGGAAPSAPAEEMPAEAGASLPMPPAAAPPAAAPQLDTPQPAVLQPAAEQEVEAPPPAAVQEAEAPPPAAVQEVEAPPPAALPPGTPSSAPAPSPPPAAAAAADAPEAQAQQPAAAAALDSLESWCFSDEALAAAILPSPPRAPPCVPEPLSERRSVRLSDKPLKDAYAVLNGAQRGKRKQPQPAKQLPSSKSAKPAAAAAAPAAAAPIVV